MLVRMDTQSRADLVRERQALQQELIRVRRAGLEASARGDFRAAAKLTVDAARLNRAIADTQAREQLAV